MNHEELSERLLMFAVRVGKLIETLPDTRLARHISGQLIRSATSPAPNYEEACAAESRPDFIHKLNICLKELRESRLWLRMILMSELLRTTELAPVIDGCTQLCNIIGSSIVTAKRNASRHK